MVQDSIPQLISSTAVFYACGCASFLFLLRKNAAPVTKALFFISNSFILKHFFRLDLASHESMPKNQAELLVQTERLTVVLPI
jgi:hypothetical protein